MKSPKLSDEELSRILSQSAAGRLRFCAIWDNDDCTCPAGAAYGTSYNDARTGDGVSEDDSYRAYQISEACSKVAGEMALAPDDVLTALERVGLA